MTAAKFVEDVANRNPPVLVNVKLRVLRPSRTNVFRRFRLTREQRHICPLQLIAQVNGEIHEAHVGSGHPVRREALADLQRLACGSFAGPAVVLRPVLAPRIAKLHR